MPLPIGVGCWLVAPMALFGAYMIADYPGPVSFTEYFGWLGLCLIVAATAAGLLRRFREGGRRRVFFFVLFLGVPVGFAALIYLDTSPATPVRIKSGVEHFMAIIGVPAIGVLLAYVAWITWKVRRV